MDTCLALQKAATPDAREARAILLTEREAIIKELHEELLHRAAEPQPKLWSEQSCWRHCRPSGLLHCRRIVAGRGERGQGYEAPSKQARAG